MLSAEIKGEEGMDVSWGLFDLNLRVQDPLQ